MLQEIPRDRVKQLKGEDNCRWFRDDYFDLFVWIGHENGIRGFQLYYDIFRDQRALFWNEPSGYSHHVVDDGENRPGKPKGSPMVMDGGRFEKDTVINEFNRRNHAMDRHIADAILNVIRHYPIMP